MKRCKSGYLLETLVNNNLLVYDLVTSENDCSSRQGWEQDNQQERLDFI